jgi:hypothetical protein
MGLSLQSFGGLAFRRLVMVCVVCSAPWVASCGEEQSAQDDHSGRSSAREAAADARTGVQDAHRAAQTIQEMLRVARADDWDNYVDRFYGETDKFRSPEDRQALVKRFEDRWGKQILPVLETASHLTPEIDADRAVFREGQDVVFVLYRGADGDWGFHL